MQLTTECLTRLAIGKDDLKLSRIDDRPIRERPLIQIAIINRERIPIESYWARSGIVEFDPGIVLSVVVRDPIHVIRLDFVDPKQRKRIEAGGRRIGSAGTERTRP